MPADPAVLPVVLFLLFSFLLHPLFLLPADMLCRYLCQLDLCGLRYCIFPNRSIALPGIFHIMDRETVTVFYANAGSIHIFGLHLGAKLSRTAADKDPSQQNFPTGMKQIYTDIAAAYINLLDIHLDPALRTAHVDLGKPYIFSFFSTSYAYMYEISLR